MRSDHRWVSALVAALAAGLLVVVLAGCGGDDDTFKVGTGSESSDPSPSAPSSTKGSTRAPAAIDDGERQSAEAAAVEVARAAFSTDYRRFDDAVDEALSRMTPSYAATYRATKDKLRADALRSKLLMRAEVSDVGISAEAPGDVTVLVYLTQNTATQGARPTTTQSRALLRMVYDDDWLLDDVQTSAEAAAGAGNPGDRQAALVAAGALAEAFVSVDYRTFDSDSRTIKARATGDFLRDYESAEPTLAQTAERSMVVTEGSVEAAALSDFSADRATALVATDGTRSSQGGEPAPRGYRLVLGLRLVDGDWLVDSLMLAD